MLHDYGTFILLSAWLVIFSIGKCIPITRGGGIFQEHMNEALELLSEGEWVMPEKFFRGKRPPVPLWNKRINIVIGDRIEFNLPQMGQMAVAASRDKYVPITGWPSPSPHGLNDAALSCLYTDVFERIQAVMECLRFFSNRLFGS